MHGQYTFFAAKGVKRESQPKKLGDPISVWYWHSFESLHVLLTTGPAYVCTLQNHKHGAFYIYKHQQITSIPS